METRHKPPMVSPNAVIFDLDETLVVGEAAAVQSFMDICHEAEVAFGVKADALYQAIRTHSRSLWHNSPHHPFLLSLGLASFEGLCSTFEGEYPGFALLREWAPQFRRESWQKALKACGIDDDRLALKTADAYLANRKRHQALYDDAGPCLRELSNRYPLALLTNGAPDLQYEKIATTGIGQYFKAIAVSGEAGCGKPDRRFFELVLNRLGTDAAHTWMVGDSLERDIAGAQALGMNTVWINRDDIRHDQTVNPDIEVSGLDLLTAIIG